MKKRIILLPILSLLLSGCSGGNFFKNLFNKDPSNEKPIIEPDNKEEEDEEEDDGVIHVSSITLNKNQITLLETETITLSYTILPSNAENKNVEWNSSDSIIASVENGVVKAWNVGSCDITVKALDGDKISTCKVTVSKQTDEKEMIDLVYDFNKQGYNKNGDDKFDINGKPIAVTDDISITYNANEGTSPIIMAYDKVYSGRAYAKNTITIKSNVEILSKIKLTFGKKDGSNEITSNVGSFNVDTWIGSAKEIILTIGGESEHRRITSFTISYIAEPQEDPNKVINLGEMKISEVKNYIKENPVSKNSFGNGVNEKRYVTIKGFALAIIDTVKTSQSSGLDMTYPQRVIIGDDTDIIGVASNYGDNTIINKIGNNVCKETSKYTVIGYISEIQGNPELKILSYTYTPELELEWNPEFYSKAIITINEFYTSAQNVNYNVAGHGYGSVVTIKNLTCFNMESGGSGKRYYNFTDGSKSIRVNAYNINNASINHSYDITGIISLKDLSPIIIAFNIKSSQNDATQIDYENYSLETTVNDFLTIHGSQDDTTQKFPDVISAYGNIYKVNCYLVPVVENGSVYLGLCDTWYEELSGKDSSMSGKKVILIENNNFWNISYEECARYNPYNDDCVVDGNKATFYFVPKQLRYKNNNPMWQVLLVPQSIPAI